MNSSNPPVLIIESHVETGRVTLVVTGEVDLATAPQLRQACLTGLTGGVGCLHLDLTGVTFMDSTGLHVLIATQRRAELIGNHLALLPSSHVQRTLSVSGLAKMFVAIGACACVSGPAGSASVAPDRTASGTTQPVA